MPTPAHIETLLNNAFLTVPLTPEEEAMIAAYEYLDHAEDLEAFDHWSIQPALTWNQ